MTRKRLAASEADDLLRLNQQLCFPLYAATNLVQRLYRPLLAPLGLTYSQYLVMLLLWERQSASVSELRDCLYLDMGTMSPLLKRMEQAGLITRQRDTQDERRVLIALTAHGRSLRERAKAVPETLARQVMLNRGEGENLRGLVQSLVRRLSAALPAGEAARG